MVTLDIFGDDKHWRHLKLYAFPARWLRWVSLMIALPSWLGLEPTDTFVELHRAPLGPPASVLLDLEFWSRDGPQSDGCVLPTWMQGAVLSLQERISDGWRA